MAKLTTEEFIKKAREVHRDKYDYSPTEYVNVKTKVSIICPVHGVFCQRPDQHLAGRGCPKCGSKSITQSQFIEEARKVHGDKYDYSKVDYVNVLTKITIICPEHGDFLQSPREHLTGRGCPTCGGSKQLSTKEFVERAYLVHGNKYDYSKVEYVNNQTKVTIICPKHGEFQQAPAGHLGGQGCPKCGYDRGSASRKKHQEDFIEEAKKVWGDKYDYSLVNYVNSKTAINVICKEHGVFSPLPNNFLRGHGCPQCGLLANSAARAYSKEFFICKAKEIHGDKYDYSKVIYKTSKTPVIIICPTHGEFCMRPDVHLHLHQGCPKCAGVVKSTTEEFIEKSRKVHGDKYDYSLVEYDGNKKPVKIICPTHGVFEQSPNAHLRGSGCLECSGVRLLTTEEFIILARQVHGDTYDYSLVDYQGNKKKVKIVCPKHGVFEQVPNSHLSGRGCPHCTESKGEESVRLYLKKNNINFIAYHSFDDCRNINPLSFDFYLPDCNVCIEYQGLQHYEEVEAWGGQEGFEYRQHLDNIKRQYCKDNGIRLIEIRYDEDVEKVLKKALQGLNVPRKDSI